MVYLPLIKFTKHAKGQRETQSEEKKKTTVPDLYMMFILESTDRENKIKPWLV